MKPGKAARVVLIIDYRKPDRIYVDGIVVFLQFLQFKLIAFLASYPGVCIPRQRIYAELWGTEIVEEAQIYFQVGKLRKAIAAANPRRKSLIKTIPKRGVMLNLWEDQVLIIDNPVPAVRNSN